MQLHLVGGFLGSGKTTAIIEAARLLMSEGLKVGVVTNDQGKYLVDTAFVRLSDLPAVEVTGGCFCCNFNDLNEKLVQLVSEIKPDVVFAESVGSCADIVATVVKPLGNLDDDRIQPTSFSVFVDGRLLKRWYAGEELPFSKDVVYIFEKQIEEAGMLVINKMDLLSPGDIQLLEERVGAQGDDILFRFQNSLSKKSVQGWVNALRSGAVPLPGSSLEIDYDRYGRGEAHMAWLDETLTLSIQQDDPRMVIIDWLNTLLGTLKEKGFGVGHLKFVLQSGEWSAKLSFTSVDEMDWEDAVPEIALADIQILVNARVETTAVELRQIILLSLQQTQEKHTFSYEETNVEFFHPGEPKPTYRIS